MANFDPQALGQAITADIAQRLALLPLSPEEAEENADILMEFGKIAVQMLGEKQGIEMPAPGGGNSMISLDEKIATQAISLFAEGVYFSMAKCVEMGITGDVKRHLLQNLAMNVYEQAEQIVASTYGQEHTPDFQFTHEQQVDLVNQGAESALLYHINEYEREYGPIEIQAPAEQPQQPLLQNTHSAAEVPVAPIPAVSPPPPVATPRPKGPTPHDKYGAVALLLGTLPADQRARIMKNFNPEEKELIAYYSYPKHIEQNLDVACVQTHLQRFKVMLEKGGPGLKSAAYRSISTLAKSYPLEKLLSCVKDERPAVKSYLESHYASDPAHATLAGLTGLEDAPEQSRHFSEGLSSRIEEILYRFLARRLELSQNSR